MALTHLTGGRITLRKSLISHIRPKKQPSDVDPHGRAFFLCVPSYSGRSEARLFSVRPCFVFSREHPPLSISLIRGVRSGARSTRSIATKPTNENENGDGDDNDDRGRSNATDSKGWLRCTSINASRHHHLNSIFLFRAIKL